MICAKLEVMKAMSNEAVPMWERLPNEPGNWYARFEFYRLLGPKRTLNQAYRMAAKLEGLRGKRAGQGWSEAARRWDWTARAEAWDQAQRERLRAGEEDRRFDARERRLQMIDRLLEAVFDVLLRAEMDMLDSEEALTRLPTLRLLFKDLIGAQRAELGLPAAGQEAGAEPVRLTADDLIAAQRELERWNE